MMSSVSRCVRRLMARLLADDRGQDLVEYALLTGIIAVASLLVFMSDGFKDRIKNAYENRNTQVNAIAAPNAPIP